MMIAGVVVSDVGLIGLAGIDGRRRLGSRFRFAGLNDLGLLLGGVLTGGRRDRRRR
jgi:hypothetical protein